MEDLRRAKAGAAPVHRWDDLLAAGRALPDDVEEVAARARRGDTACIIYTSGTGGVPRGVMLSHGALLCHCMGAYKLLVHLGLGHDVFLSFLPHSHDYRSEASRVGQDIIRSGRFW